MRRVASATPAPISRVRDNVSAAVRGLAADRLRAYLIDAEGIEMAERAGAYIVPTMQMTQEDLHGLQRT